MEFTKEEISLCKQVAEKCRKELAYGDWYISYEGVIRLKTLHQKSYRQDEAIPLWTISDCLEWLNQTHSFKTQLYNTKWNWYCKTKRYEIGAKEYFARGKTPLEACLKAVLAIIEED